MAKKNILSVGVEIPGGEIESVHHLSGQTLLDGDIIVFSPEVPWLHGYGSETYLGKPCLSDDSSFRAKEAIFHWKRELAAAVDAGKLVIVLLEKPETVYVATGRMEYSGTGRNARTTRVVEQLGSYSSLPVGWRFQAVSGTEMSLVPDARFFAPYWAEFGKHSRYEVYLEGDVRTPLVKTKSGNRIVGAIGRRGRGALLGVPALILDSDEFTETQMVDGKETDVWSKSAQRFGKRFISTIVALSDALASEVSATPPPDWAQADTYRLPEEATIEEQIAATTAQILALEENKRGLESQLSAAGSLRGLLFEQGKALEHAVIQALTLMGFKAEAFKNSDSEFDAVFVSDEGRCIGEVEGKDNSAINIAKFSQLERNLNEDFAREDVDEYAKGVLIGNAFRLKPPESRDPPFTSKCLTAASRLGVSLISSPDLFAPARYLKESQDSDYAVACRRAIFQASGGLTAFPAPPAALAVETKGSGENMALSGNDGEE